jgi:hypothetical protein
MPTPSGPALLTAYLTWNRIDMESDKTIAEQLDEAETGEEFGKVIQGFFGLLEKQRDRD